MNKVVFGIIGLVIVALAGGVFIASGSDEETANTGTNSSSQMQDQAEQSSSQEESEIELQSSGANGIMEYSPEALAASETDNNLLFFHAGWCTVCNQVERNIEAGSIPDDLSIFKVDYDSAEGQSLAANYNIPIQYSMVQVDTEGNEVTQWVNNFSDGIDEISSNLL
jgi:hypothetical protein